MGRSLGSARCLTFTSVGLPLRGLSAFGHFSLKRRQAINTEVQHSCRVQWVKMKKVISVAVFFALSACQQKPEAPELPPVARGSCSDPSVLEAVRSIIRSNSKGAAGRDEAAAAQIAQGWAKTKIEFDGVRTTKRDEGSRLSNCAAQLRLIMGAQVFEAMATNVLGAATVGRAGYKRDGDAALVDITYTAQPTDNNKQVYAELFDGKEIAESAGVLVYAAVMPTPVAATAQSANIDTAPAQAVQAARAPSDNVCEGLDTSITVNQMECLRREFAEADKALNSNYKAAMARLDASGQAALRTKQRGWLAAKSAACEKAGEEFAGGTAEAVLKADCQVQRTRARAVDLGLIR